jgi:hypothetical protein
MGVDGQGYFPAILPPENRPGIHFIEGWMRTSARFDFKINVKNITDRILFCHIYIYICFSTAE